MAVSIAGELRRQSDRTASPITACLNRAPDPWADCRFSGQTWGTNQAEGSMDGVMLSLGHHPRRSPMNARADIAAGTLPLRS